MHRLSFGSVEVHAEPFRQFADLNLLGRVGEILAQGPSGAVAISAWAQEKYAGCAPITVMSTSTRLGP
jgi:hypothetical protein